MSEIRSEIGHYLASQPLGDEQVSDDDLALLLYVATHHSQFGRVPRVSQIAAARGLTHQETKRALRRLRALGQLGGFYGRDLSDPPHLMVVR